MYRDTSIAHWYIIFIVYFVQYEQYQQIFQVEVTDCENIYILCHRAIFV